MRRSSRVGLIWALLMGIIFVCFIPSTASAHAYIVKSDPAANAVLNFSPGNVRIWYDEPIQPLFGALQVYADDGTRVDESDAHVGSSNPRLLECTLKPSLPHGLYSVVWKVISADGHPVSGVIPFSVGKTLQGTSSANIVTSHGYTPGIDMIVIRWLMYVSFAMLVGIPLCRLLVLSAYFATDERVTRRFHRISCTAWALAFISVGLSLPLQTKIEAGVASWTQAITPGLISQVLRSSTFGKIWETQEVLLICMSLLIFVGVAFVKTNRLIWLLVADLGIGLLVTKSLSSHAAARPNPELPIFMDAAHLIASSVWLGGILGLFLLLPRYTSLSVEGKRHYWRSIRRMSFPALSSVLVLVVTGVYASLYYVPTAYGLVHTSYGHALLWKLVLVFTMGMFGIIHFVMGRGEPPIHRLKSTLFAEFAVGAVILVVTAVLTNLPIARATPGPFEKSLFVESGQSGEAGPVVTLSITPNVRGANTISVGLKSAGGVPYERVQQVTVELKYLDMAMGTETVRLRPLKPGIFEARSLGLTMSGPWLVTVHVLTQDFQDLDTTFQILVGSDE